LVDHFEAGLGQEGIVTAAGVFGALMALELVNDGPFTILLEKEAQQR
jgi:D-tyrosyl-tRNA(Tyr) deacylase